jgi:hypothetical protein
MTHFTTLRMRAAYVVATVTVLFLSGLSFGQKVQSPQAGPLRPNLGTASTYAIFTGAGAINNTGLSKLTGDVGQDGAYAFNGFPPGTYTGTLNRANAASASAKSALLTAWTTEASVANDIVLGVGIADGQSFDPKVYHSGGASTTTGNITFNAHGDASAIFIVKIGGALSANAGTHILLSNGALAANIYWFVDGAVNIADNSTFKGVIVARGAITFLGTSTLDGRALTTAGEIKLAANNMGPVAPGPGNNITVITPAKGDSVKGGTLSYKITWSGTGIASKKIFQYSLDSGLTWKTIDTITADVFTHNWNVPDTVSKKALVRITDGNSLIGVSGLFMIKSSKIIVVHPALADTVIAATQNYSITWTGTGLASTKIFEYSLDGGVTWKTIDTISADVLTHNWKVPDTASILAVIRITDKNGITGKSGVFTIKRGAGVGSIVVAHPAAGEIIIGGTKNYQITWTGTSIASKKTFEYSLDSGLTWKTIGTITADVFTFTWNVPDTVSKKALVRITDGNNVKGVSGIFKITSSITPGGITVVRPALGEVIAGGTLNYQITWTGTGLATQKNFELSLDGGQTWKPIGTITADVFTFNWNVPDTASIQAVIRITDKNGITGKSGIFTIVSSKSPFIVVVRPAPGEIVAGGTQNYLITWTGTGLAAQKNFELSLDGGQTWKPIGTITADVLTFSWTVPDTASIQAVIRITDNKGITGKSGVFTITSSKPSGSIVVTHPVLGEVIDGGTQNFLITFTATNTAPQKMFEYSTDGGVSWNFIGILNSDALTYPWASVPNVQTTQALVRITDPTGVSGTSGLFTINKIAGIGSIDGITLTGLDSKNNIGNGKTLGISWTFTPDIGTSVLVEVSLDYTATWIQVANNPISEPQTSWTTKNTGYYNPVFVRVTSTLGMTRTSGPFSIGTNASVSSDASKNGYSVSNYPNPATSQTTINLVLPVASDVTLRVTDGLGREVETIVAHHFDAGSYNIPFDASKLSAGMYTYILQAGSTKIAGKMSIVK